MDLKPLARQEREEFAALLKTLTPEQWDAPTLCTEWRVRDVVAHVISYDELSPSVLVRRFAKGRFLLNRTNAVNLTGYAERSPEELLSLLEAHLEPRGLTAVFGAPVALLDGLIHQQDIRRPLGLPRDIPAERLIPALRGAFTTPVLRGFWRARGVRLIATDVDWSAGKGPEVKGPGEALMMTMAGRRGIVQELSGPGQRILADRLGP